MLKARHVLLAASVLCIPFAPIPAWSQNGGSSIGNSGLGASRDGPDQGTLDKVKELIEKQRPDGSTNLGEGDHFDFQFDNGARLQNGVMGGDDYSIDYPNCSTAANVSVKPPVKECLADRSQGSTGTFYEVQYVEFTCPDLTPPFRRLALKFKKLGPCKPADYNASKQKAETYGETWTPTDQVTFNDTGDGGQKTAQGDGQNPPGGGANAADPNAMPEGWTIRMVAFFENDIEIIWEYKDGNQYTAIYRRDGTSNWTYKGDKPEYPTSAPPQKPKSFYGRSLEIETAKAPDGKAPDNKTPDNKPSKTADSTEPGKPDSGKSGGNTPGSSTGGNNQSPQQGSDKPNKAADSTPPGKPDAGKSGGNTPGSSTGDNNQSPQQGSDKPKVAAAPAGQPTPDSGFVRVMGSGGKWFWVSPTGGGVVSVDPNDKASGPTTPLGNPAAGWKSYVGADGKTYWVMPGTKMLPAEVPKEPSGWTRVQGAGGKWFWVLPTNGGVVSVDPNDKASGPTNPLGNPAAGWKEFTGADGKTYWVLPGTAMLPADPPTQPSGWARVQGTDGKWFWVLPTGKSVIVVDPNQKASGPTIPLGGADAGWKQFKGADGKTYWVLNGATMLPTDAPSEPKSASTPKKDKSAKKKSNGRIARSSNSNVEGPSAADVATAVGTGLAIGSMISGGGGGGGMRQGQGSMAPASSRASTGSGMAVRQNSAAKPGKGSSGQSINTTVGKPTIRMQGMGFGF